MIDGTFNVSNLPEVTFDKGEKILIEGEQGTTVYILKSGDVAVTAGGDELCRVSEPMSVFGEIAAIHDGVHTATVSAVSPSSFYKIDDFMTYLAVEPEAAVQMLRMMSGRLLSMNKRFLEFKSTLDTTFSSEASLKDQFNTLLLCLDSILGRSLG